MKYVHGYDQLENTRLQDQAETLVELLHSDTGYAPGERVLEAGCGVGSQTVTLARRSPGSRITSIDISARSIEAAKQRIKEHGIENVEFAQADVFDLPFPNESFDHIFLCFVLEHLNAPVDALKHLMRVLKPGGTITAIEGDHGSTFFHPDNPKAQSAIDCLVRLQRISGGNANIGRELYPLFRRAEMESVQVSPRMVYVDANRPEFIEGFTKNTFTAMIDGIRKSAIEAGMISEAEFDEGIRALLRTTEPDGVFCYTFFKAVGTKSR